MTKEKLPWTNWIASLTDRCENRCPGCYRVLQGTLSNKGQDMSSRTFTTILDIFASRGGRNIDTVGGEPLLNPEFPTMLDAALGRKMNVWIYTNLRPIARNPSVASYLRQKAGEYPGALTIVGKLNVPDITNPGQRALQKRLIGSDETGVREMWNGLDVLLQKDFPSGSIGIENLLRKKNIAYAPAVYEMGLRNGFFVDLELPTCPVTATLAGFEQWLKEKPLKQQVLQLVTDIDTINRRYGIKQFTPMPPHITGRNALGIGTGCVSFKKDTLLTETDGRVGVCTSGMPVRDTNGRQFTILTDPIDAILASPTLNGRRNATIQTNIKSGPCNTCDSWGDCMAGCAAFREGVMGDISESYGLCYKGTWLSDRKLRQKAIQNLPGNRYNK